MSRSAPLESGFRRGRALGLLLLAGAGLLAAGGRVARIQATRGDQLRARATGQHATSIEIPAQRGAILDARGRLLAGSVRKRSVYVDPFIASNPRFAAYSVAPVLGLDPFELERTLVDRRERRFVWVKRAVTDAEFAAFTQVVRARRLTEFGGQQEPQRIYPLGRTAAAVLGFVGADQRGLAGVELLFNDVMTGRRGQRGAKVDARRRRVRPQLDEYRAPSDGASVVLTLDAHIQQRAEHHLRLAVEENKAHWGAAVVLDPRTGEVWAIANMPDFDPAHPFPDDGRMDENLERVRNRAIADCFEPGSIFKTFIAAPALDEGLTRLNETFEINGPTHRFGSRVVSDTHVHGSLTLAEVIAKSSNIGMGLLGQRCGNQRLFDYVRRFGFGERTGIELPGEHTGLVQDFSRWTSYSTSSIPIGYEVAVTPIQVAAAFAAVCNGGTLYQARIVRGVIAANGDVLEDRSTPIVVRQALDERSAREFRFGALAEVVRNGTGQKAAIPDYQVFGKSGTARVARADGRGYVPGAYAGSFVAAAPLEEPRAVVFVTLYRPKGSAYYGGTVSAPTAGAILADTLTYLGAPPDAPRDARRRAF